MKAAVLLALAAIVLQASAANAATYRYVRMTKFKDGAPVSDLVAKQAADIKTCSKFYLSAVIGKGAGALPSPDWGSTVRLIDFKDVPSYTGYLGCIDKAPNAASIRGFIVPGGESRALVTLSAKNKPLTALPDNAFVHLGMYNTTDVKLQVTLRTQLMADFSGKAVIDYIPGVSPWGQPTTPPQNVDFANIIVLKYPSSALGYYYFKHGDAKYNVDPNPFYARVSKLIPTGPYDCDFFFSRV